MRRQAPVFRDPVSGRWMVFAYSDVRRVLSEWRTFSSRIMFEGQQPGNDFTRSLSFTDPPRHTLLRSLVQQVFTPRRVAEFASRIAALVDELLDGIAGADAADAVADFAIPLPTSVISEILGVPATDRVDFRRLSHGVATGETVVTQELGDYFRRLIAERRSAPGPDLISGLIAAHESGESLSAQELVDFCILLLVAGNETTIHLISNAILTLDEHPDARERLREEPHLMESMIEEVLRFRSPIQGVGRITTAEVTLGSRTIPAGEVLISWIGSANRDETQFERADAFLIDRQPNPHLAFSKGIHTCLGASLARLEAKIALSALLGRFPDLRVAPDVPLEALPSKLFCGVKALPVRF